MKRRGFIKFLVTASAGVVFASGYLFHVTQRLYRKFINVKDYGAVGDGVTDDAPAIQRAMDSLAEGGTLQFPTGEYLLKKQISISQYRESR